MDRHHEPRLNPMLHPCSTNELNEDNIYRRSSFKNPVLANITLAGIKQLLNERKEYTQERQHTQQTVTRAAQN